MGFRAPQYKVPRRIHFTAARPRTAVGKVARCEVASRRRRRAAVISAPPRRQDVVEQHEAILAPEYPAVAEERRDAERAACVHFLGRAGELALRFLPRGPLLENMLENREPVVAPEHLRTDKERRHSKRPATESLFRGRGKDSLGFWILKCRPKQIVGEADLLCQRDTDGLVDRPGIRSVDRCAYPPAVIRGSAKPLGCRSGSGEQPEIEVMTRRLSESDSVVVGPETRIAFSV
jgi:hypothetical protein